MRAQNRKAGRRKNSEAGKQRKPRRANSARRVFKRAVSLRPALRIERLEAREMLTSDTPNYLAISACSVPEGGATIVTVKWSSIDPQGSLQLGTSAGASTYTGIDYQSDYSFNGAVPGTGEKQFAIKALDDKGFGGEQPSQSVIVGAHFYTPDGGPKDATISVPIDDSGMPSNCTCSCSCGNVEASTAPLNGRPLVNSGQGHQPEDFGYIGDARPHPIVTVNDTLSSNVAQATDVNVQTVLTDLSGNILYTTAPVYYSTAGYTAGKQVQYSQELDATGLADGTYCYTTAVTEDYSTGPVMRSYSGFVPIRNLDNSAYGSGWTLKNVDRLVVESGSASLVDGSGNVFYFPIDYAGQYDPPADRPDIQSLVQNRDGTFTLTYRDGSLENFAASGLLTAAIDKNGNETTYQWNPDATLASSTNQSGETTTFAYTGGLLTSVTDFAGRVISYAYTNGQLTSITTPDPGHGEQQHVTTMGYDSNTGMLTTITDAGGTATLHYNNFRQVSSITAPDNTTTEYAAPSSMSLVDTSTGVGTQSNPAPLVYTANVSGSTTDGNGHTSSYTVDPTTGETLSTTDAIGQNTTTFQYNGANQVTQITQPPITSGGANLVTTLGYDVNGNLDQETFPDGTSESWTFDPTWNEPTKFIDPAGRETDYTLDPSNGNVLTVTQVGTNGDANRVTTYTYTPNPTAQGQTPGGLVAMMVDPRGIETEYSYNSRGLVTSIVYAAGTSQQASVSFTYDQNDNLASYENEISQTTLFVFDNSNRLVKEQDPPPDPSQPNVRPTYTWSYDTRGNMLQEVDPMNRLTSFVYGPGSDGDDPDLDQMIQPDPNGGTNYTVTTYGHDNADNVTSITDPLSRIQSMGFDADNRQTSVTLPNPLTGGSGGPTESVVLNALGFPVQQFDLAGSETDNTFNWRGQVLTTVGPAVPDGHGGQAHPTETFTYNADGQTLTDENPLSATTQYIYNSFGELVEEILPDPDGSGPLTSPTLHWTYNADGDVASYQDGNGNVYAYTYNDRNELVQENDPSPDGGHTPGPVWQWQYNAAQELVETIDPMQRVTQYVVDGDANVIQTIASNLSTGGPGDASTTTFDTYDLDNEKLSETTPNGATTTWQVDDLGRIVQETQPVPQTGEAAPVWQYQFDADSELTQVTNPLGLTQTSTFNGMGQMTSQTSFAGVPTAWTYNNLSEILTETVGSGSLAQTTTNTWDTLGDKLSVQDANGTTSMAYDLAQRMTSLTDPDQNQTVWTRDNLGRVISEQNPSGTETLGYDANSNLIKQVDFKGQERDFVFDDLNRETAEKWMSGGSAINTINTAYNADGQVVSTGDNYSDYAFGYDGEGHQTGVDNAGTPNLPHVVLNSVYNAQGERTSLAANVNGYADFINSYGYDALSRLNQIDQQGQSGGNSVAPKSIYVGYDGVGDITELDYTNAVTQGQNHTGPGYATLSYSSTTGLLAGINDVANGTSIDSLAYTYDPLARVSTFTSIDGTATYGYDHTSQLVSATYTTASGGHQPANQSFTWDGNGNNAAPGNVVSANNEVTNDGTFTYQFDADGNRTVRTRISNVYATDYRTTYTWDYRNRLTDVEYFDNNGVLTKRVHYVFDVFDNLIEEDIDPTGQGTYTSIEQFALDVVAQPPSAGNAPLEHFDASGNLVPALPADTLLEFINGALAYRFLNGPSPSGADVIYAEGKVASLFQPDATDWVFINNQGSPTDTVDSNGNLIDHQVWSAFGKPAYESDPSVLHLQGFSGGIFDVNAGLIKFGERWYDPQAMVWIGRDPAGFLPGDWDPTRYAGNNATSRVDPSGLAGDSVSRSVLQAIKSGDILKLQDLINSGGLNAASRAAAQAAIKRLQSTAQQIIAKECKAAVKDEFPRQFMKTRLKDIMECWKKNRDIDAKKALKLLNDNRFKKGAK